jgi:hypothetical protein
VVVWWRSDTCALSRCDFHHEDEETWSFWYRRDQLRDLLDSVFVLVPDANEQVQKYTHMWESDIFNVENHKKDRNIKMYNGFFGLSKSCA